MTSIHNAGRPAFFIFGEQETMEALAQTVTITLPDGSTRKVPAGMSNTGLA